MFPQLIKLLRFLDAVKQYGTNVNLTIGESSGYYNGSSFVNVVTVVDCSSRQFQVGLVDYSNETSASPILSTMLERTDNWDTTTGLIAIKPDVVCTSGSQIPCKIGYLTWVKQLCWKFCRKQGYTYVFPIISDDKHFSAGFNHRDRWWKLVYKVCHRGECGYISVSNWQNWRSLWASNVCLNWLQSFTQSRTSGAIPPLKVEQKTT